MSEFKINPTPPILLADLGATNARFAMVTGPNQEQIGLLRSSDYPSLAAAAQAFLRSLGDGPRPTRAAFAVAAPVIGDLVTFTNLPWRFSIRDLRDALGLNHLDVINDLAATALGLPSLTPKDHRPIGDGIAEPGAPIAVLGPGSGLGVSGLLPGPTGGTVISGEGGSGGALALAVADRVLILENALYFVITPESCAAIMWRDASHKQLAAEAMRISAPEVAALGCVDQIVLEPLEGIHNDRVAGTGMLAGVLKEHLAQLKAIPIDSLVAARQVKFRNIAQFYTEG